MDAATLTNAAAAAKSTAMSDLAAFQANPIGHSKTLIATQGRPTAMSVIAWVGACGILLGLFGTIGAMAAGAIVGGVIALALLLVATVAVLGFFGMRKWAVVVYAGQVAFTIVSMLVQGGFSIVPLVLPAIVLALCAKHYSAMK